MIRGFFEGLNERGVSPVIAIVLLLMMTVAAAGAAYFWLTSIQSGMQKRSTKSIENIMQQAGRRLIAQAAICEPTAPEGMVAWYEFEKGSGDEVHDSSEKSNNGTVYGATWTDGKVGQALKFTGDYVEVPDDPSLDISGNATVSLWFRTYQKFNEYDGVIEKCNDTYGFGMVGSYNSTKIIAHGDSNNMKTGSLNLDQWYHIALVSSGGTLYLYVNGSQVGSTSGTISTNPKNLRIGDRTVASNKLEGSVDEVRIYDRALTPKEINETYKGKMKVKMTVRNVGSVKIPEAEFVANLKKDGTTVDSDTYTTTSSIETDDLKTLTFYFNEMRPGGEYTVSIPGIDVSQTVKCQSLES